ncbi:MAG: hypothetical protein JO156_07365 [Solirubrobacterales bacterium]|nr:hypothetical protein [Solirubrobacterales bacterium]
MRGQHREPLFHRTDGAAVLRVARRAQRRKLVEYDALEHRVWILGQRCHHGATGSIVAVAGCVVLLGERHGLKSLVPLMVVGGFLMAHDWKDRSVWFKRGYGS